MEDYRLKVFYSVAKNQSFTKAAAELFITQPAISKHIKLLEEDLGIRLFERKGSFILPTLAGEILFKYAKEIFGLYQEAIYEIGALKNKQDGKLRLGASTTIAQYLISAVLASFYEKFPIGPHRPCDCFVFFHLGYYKLHNRPYEHATHLARAKRSNFPRYNIGESAGKAGL